MNRTGQSKTERREPSDLRHGKPLPLAGRRVVVTRAIEQARGLASSLAAAGAEVASLPLLEIVPPADPKPLQRAVRELALYDWVVFTSANAVEALLPLAGGELPQGVGVAAVGPATSAALRAWGVEPLVQPSGGDSRPGGAQALLAELLPFLSRGGSGGSASHVLLPQAADALPTLAEGLAAAGVEAVVAAAYDKALPRDAPRQAACLFTSDLLGWVTFTSPRIVRHFAELLGSHWEWRRCELLAASIGTVTSAELRELGVEPAAQAVTPSDDGLVEAVIAAVTSAARSTPAPPNVALGRVGSKPASLKRKSRST